MLHVVSQDSEAVHQPTIFDWEVLEFLEKSAQCHGLPRHYISVDLFNVSGGVPLPNDVLDKLNEMLLSHYHAVQCRLLPLAVRIFAEKNSHV